MKSLKFYLFSLKRNFFAIIFIIFLFCLLIFSNTNMQATKSGLMLWANSVVPSLFPFLVATELLSYTNIVNLISKKLEKSMRYIFNMPGSCAYPFILGIISGYPVGAKTVVQIYKEGLCTKKEAELMLAYTNNSGPLFIIGTVGISMFGSSQIGFLLLFTHILASISVGIVYGKIYKNDKSINSTKFSRVTNTTITFSSIGEVLSNSIINSIKTLFIVGGYVVIFSVIISILQHSNLLNIFSSLPFLSEFITGLIELTNGLYNISNVYIKNISANILISSFLLGFAGISIMLQILSIICKEHLSIKPYILGKIMQACFATLYTFVLLQLPIFSFNL